MAYLKAALHPPHPLHVFTTNPSRHPSSITSTKSLKALIHTLILALRALRRAKSVLLRTLLHHNHKHNHNHKNKVKILFGSFRLHYNWGSPSSSRVLPVPESVLRGFSHVEGAHRASVAEQSSATLAGYLLWLEERNVEDDDGHVVMSGEDGENIDRLAEMFIAGCHEKFLLEKEESMRRFQEMVDRSV